MKDDSIRLDLIGSHSLLWFQTNQSNVLRSQPNKHAMLCKPLHGNPHESRLVTEIDCSCSDFQPIKDFIQTDYHRVARFSSRWSRGTKTLGTRLIWLNFKGFSGWWGACATLVSFVGWISKNSSSARPARAFYILIHFVAVLALTTAWNDQIWGLVVDESTWRWIFNFISKYPHRSHQFYSWNVDSHLPSRATWSNRKIITITENNIFKQRSRSRRRRPCLRSLSSLRLPWQWWWRGQS